MTTNLFQEINNRALATEAEAAGLSDRELLNGVPVWAIREAADRARDYLARIEQAAREDAEYEAQREAERQRKMDDEIVAHAKSYSSADNSIEARHAREAANPIMRQRREEAKAAKVAAEREGQRRVEDDILARAAALSTDNTSLQANHLRAVAEQIRDHRGAGNYTTLHR